jgi:hypothetical protein
MNLKHPYEKHLAEKLVQLPPPDDPDQNWQRMKSLLEDEMPRGGGGLLGGYRWIIPVVILLAIVSGLWFSGNKFLPMDQGSQSMAGTINKTNNKKHGAENTGVNETNTQPAEKTILPSTENQKTAETTGPENNPVLPASETKIIAPNETNQKELVAGSMPVTASNDVTATNAANPELPDEQKGLNQTRDGDVTTVALKNKKTVLPETTSTNNNEINADRKKVYTSTKNKKGKNNKNRPVNKPVRNASLAQQAQKDKLNADAAATTKEPVVAAAEEEDEETHFVSLPSVRLHKPSVRPVAKASADPVKESKVDIIVDYTGTDIITPSGVLQRNYTPYTQADLFPDLVIQKRGSGRKSGRGYEGYDKAFAVGLSLPLGFPLGDQEPLAYNRQAGVNTISDYIPSPHLQYHINSRTYFQTQVQVWSPQFIRPILLYQTQTNAQPYIYTSSVYARKLYYFNLPVSVYHSPMRNFYMGTGLQFSSMLSGVALFEDRKRNMVGPPEDYILSQKYARFSNDSLSRRFNNNEVRLLVDMNYFWNRFVVGLQYNQAFNNYVSFQVTPSSPYTFDKNKSLQFYLRYNIWEDRKKKRKSETLLSLK